MLQFGHCEFSWAMHRFLLFRMKGVSSLPRRGAHWLAYTGGKEETMSTTQFDHDDGSCRSLPKGTILIFLMTAGLLMGLVFLVGYSQGFTLELVLGAATVVTTVLTAVALFMKRLTHCRCRR